MARRSTRRSAWIAILSAAVSIGAGRTIDLEPQKFPVLGGSGGTAFSRDCGAGKVMTGLRGRTGLEIDAIGLLCRSVLADGSLGPETTVGTLSGGGGGSSSAVSCPSGSVTSGWAIQVGTWIDGVQLFCRVWSASSRTMGAGASANPDFGRFTSGRWEKQVCESRAQPASGIRGRSASLVDAVGLVCDEP